MITANQLEKLGIPQRTTYRRCQPNGPWTHLLPGIVLLARARPTARQRVEAARLHTDMLGIVTGFEATRRYGLRTVPDDSLVHVLVPHTHRFCDKKFAIVERTRYFPEPVHLDGVPLSPPARAVMDGLRRIRQQDVVSAVLLEALESGLCTYDELAKELLEGSQRGTALPRATLAELQADIRSVPEMDAASLWKRAGLPASVSNVRLFDQQGRFIGMPDRWCDEIAMAWEVDSWQYHQRGRHYAKTLERNNRYAANGIIVVQTLPSRLRTDPKAVIAELRAGVKAAKRRPRPDIRVDSRPVRRAS
ncbi:hypothetical protein SD37_05850 [Amycolatopsis orientalis]|uniref:AbiEi antitoxin C-terminal domain-containing protein n=1 Tax=Amycolatopsis orientalis TaxID=31958 RepID=A0A193CB96_AMYOR|nr:hypothetical protein SD37_05850 [Amycolatopsis orientalis]